MLEQSVGEIRDAVKSINEAMHALIRLEERHAETREALGRAFLGIERNTKDIASIREELPLLRQVQKWVIGGITGAASVVSIALIAMVIK